MPRKQKPAGAQPDAPKEGRRSGAAGRTADAPPQQRRRGRVRGTGTETSQRRSYNQYCPLARALDILGERWTLLVVRELMSGPKRFTDLQDSLIGVGTNLLTARLREMEKNGIITRRRLLPPGVATVYELTEHGWHLDDTVLSLIRWGIPLLATPKRELEHFKPHWLMQGMLGAFNKSLAEGITQTYEFRVGGEVFHIQVKGGSATGDMGYAQQPDLLWVSDSKRFMELLFRIVAPSDAITAGELQKGNKALLNRVLDLFDPFTQETLQRGAGAEPRGESGNARR